MSGKGTLNHLTSIVAIDVRGAIGCQNELPWRLKTDLAFFREQTVGNSVIMGRKTYESLGSKCLPRRNNVVLSHNSVLFDGAENCRLALSVDEALFIASRFADDHAFVIGGAQTYGEFSNLVDRYLVTIVDHQVEGADAFLSSAILQSLSKWDRREIGSFPVIDGHDEYAFSVFEVIAPDAEQREADRNKRISNFRAKLAGASKASRRRSFSSSGLQDAFAF